MSEAIRKAFEKIKIVKGSDISKFITGEYKNTAVHFEWEGFQSAYNLAKNESEKQINELMQSLKEAVEDIENWGAYASEYFQKKHNLKNVIEKHEKTIAKYS